MRRVVPGEDVGAVAEQAQDHRVVAAHELDVDRRAQAREPLDEIAERAVAGDRHSARADSLRP
jgi:hypothetical protein